MRAKARRDADRADLILAIARDLINETGNFDLPMRELAGRAKVSLRAPYEIFGSKAGIVRALLKLEQLNGIEKLRRLKSRDVLDNMIARIHLSIQMYEVNQPFYRALFRATQTYSGGDETEPAREVLETYQRLCAKAQSEDLIRPDVDTLLAGEILTDIFASELRNWAASTFDIRMVEFKIGYGTAMALAAIVVPSQVDRMQDHMLRYQRDLRAFAKAQAGLVRAVAVPT